MAKAKRSAAARREQQRATAQQNKRSQSHGKERTRRKSGKSPWLLVGGILVLVALVVGIFIYLSRQSTPVDTGLASPTVLKNVNQVNPAVLAAVGTGDVQNPLKLISGSLPALKGPTGKPEFFYFGAEYCPYCAAERWPVVVALGRFGTFSQLYKTASASDDTAPNTPTFSFYHSSYTSQYIDFVAVETQGNQRDSSGNYPTLQTPTAEQQQLVAKYGSSGGRPSFPFVDIANQYSVTGASYRPDALANMTVDDIAKGLSDKNSPVTRDILGSANYLTAAICNVTNQQPENVCKSSTIQQVELLLGRTTTIGNGGQVVSAGYSFEAVVRRPE